MGAPRVCRRDVPALGTTPAHTNPGPKMLGHSASIEYQRGAQGSKLDPILTVRPPSPRFARSLPQGRAEEGGGREAWRKREERREAEQAGRLPAASLVFPGAGRRGGAGEVGEQPAGRLGGDVAWGLCCQDNSWLGKSNSGFAEMFEMLERGMHGERWPRDR